MTASENAQATAEYQAAAIATAKAMAAARTANGAVAGSTAANSPVQKTAALHTTYEVLEEKTEWIKAAQAVGVQG